MSEAPPPDRPGPPRPPGPAPMPQAVVRKSRPISIIWLIPIVAALTGGFLAWKAISEQGPTITILFETAEGLEAGKTQVKFKDVEVGIVEAIDLMDDLEHVKLTVSMAKSAEKYLTKNTRFWVVRAQISAGQVTGLGTVLSGAYIGVDPSSEGKPQRKFVGLEKAPIVTTRDEGTLYTLRADALGSLDLGSPVYYRSLRVGQVVAHELDASGNFFTIQVFVYAPHDARINTETRFWNASGFDAVVDAEGVRIDTPSIVSMLIGGIAFDNFTTLTSGGPTTDDTIFTLYESKTATLRPRYVLKDRYLVHFEQSVGGLRAGSPVEFRGIKLGEVVHVQLTYDEKRRQVRIPVVIELEPERITRVSGGTSDRSEQRIKHFVSQGLRARLATANYLTGQLKVELDFVQDAEPAELVYGGIYPEIPTAPDTLKQIADSLASTMSKIEDVPIDEIGRKMEGLIGQLEDLTGRLNRDVAPSLESSLASLEQTLDSVERVLGPDSGVAVELQRMMRDLSEAARSARLLSENLEQRPEELLRGKSR